MTEWSIVGEERESVLYEWHTTDVCEGQPIQWELARLVFGRNTGYRVAYTSRAQPTAEMRATWIEWLRGVSLGTLNGRGSDGHEPEVRSARQPSIVVVHN